MARAEHLADLEREVGTLIRRVRRVIHERARLVHPDLQPASYLLLSHLAHEGPVRSSAIAESFGIDKGAVSRQVHHLAELGLLERMPDPADGRATLLSASEDARARLEDVNRHRRKYLDERLGEWSEEDLRGFVRGLARYNAALED
jgi:DNA-binding MarR family transcriptional regulator